MPVRQAGETDRERWLEMRAALRPEQTLDEHDGAIGRCLSTPARHAAFVHERATGAYPDGLLEISRSLDDPGVGRVQVLYVAPGARRRGVAHALLVAADAWAARAGCREMLLGRDLSLDESEAALAALGFREVSRTVNYRRRVHAPMAVQPGPAAAAAEAAAAPAPRSYSPPPAPSRSRVLLHGLLIALGVACLAMTDIFSGDLIRGGLLPVLDLVFIIYLIGLFMGRQYRRRTDTSERTARLFDTGPRPPPRKEMD